MESSSELFKTTWKLGVSHNCIRCAFSGFWKTHPASFVFMIQLHLSHLLPYHMSRVSSSTKLMCWYCIEHCFVNAATGILWVITEILFNTKHLLTSESPGGDGEEEYCSKNQGFTRSNSSYMGWMYLVSSVTSNSNCCTEVINNTKWLKNHIFVLLMWVIWIIEIYLLFVNAFLHITI